MYSNVQIFEKGGSTMKFDQVLEITARTQEHVTDYFIKSDTLNSLFKEAEEIRISKDGILEIVREDKVIGITLKSILLADKPEDYCYAKVEYSGDYAVDKTFLGKRWAETI